MACGVLVVDACKRAYFKGSAFLHLSLLITVRCKAGEGLVAPVV